MNKTIICVYQILFLLAIPILLIAGTSVTVSAEANLTEGDYYYSVADGVATITGYRGTETNLDLPVQIGGYPVTSIGYAAFASNPNLVTVVIHGGIKVIGNNAFRDSSIQSVTFEDGVETIGNYAFYQCGNLIQLSIPENIKQIGVSAFKYTGINIDDYIPAGMYKDDSGAYYRASSIIIKTHRYYDQARQIGELVNQARAEAGLGALTIDTKLMEDAMVRGSELDLSFSHTRPTGAGYSALENIGSGNTTPEGIFDDWMNSSVHHATIMNATSSYMGIGVTQSAGGWKNFVLLVYGHSGGLGSGSTEADQDVDQRIYYMDSACPITAALINIDDMQVGERCCPDLRITPTNNSSFTYSVEGTLQSSDPSVATVSDDGEIIAVKAGTTNITVTSGTLSESKEIIITPRNIPLEGIEIQPEVLQLKVGESSNLSAAKLPVDTTNDTAITWTSTNPEIASVDSSGSVTAIKYGQADIIASCDGFTATGRITVEALVPIVTEQRLTGILPGETGSQLMDGLRAGGVIKDGDQVSLYKANGEALNMSTALGTGMIIKVNDMSYTIIIYGDVNGDGQINMMDVAYLRDQIYEIDTLDGPFYRAMDVNHDNRVNLMDLATIRDAIYEVDTIDQNA